MLESETAWSGGLCVSSRPIRPVLALSVSRILMQRTTWGKPVVVGCNPPAVRHGCSYRDPGSRRSRPTHYSRPRHARGRDPGRADTASSYRLRTEEARTPCGGTGMGSSSPGTIRSCWRGSGVLSGYRAGGRGLAGSPGADQSARKSRAGGGSRGSIVKQGKGMFERADGPSNGRPATPRHQVVPLYEGSPGRVRVCLVCFLYSTAGVGSRANSIGPPQSVKPRAPGAVPAQAELHRKPLAKTAPAWFPRGYRRAGLAGAVFFFFFSPLPPSWAP